MNTTKISGAEIDRVELGGVELMRGYVYRVRPGDDATMELVQSEGEGEDGYWYEEKVSVGFHGNDAHPCSGNYLADEGKEGYLVISEHEDADEIERVTGWIVEPADDLDDNWVYSDGTWTAKVICKHGRESHEYTIAGHC